MTLFPTHHPDMPRTGTELILVRHGQSVANARGVAQGRADFPLSEKGRRQAALTAERVAALAPIAAVYASPLSRAAQTAAPIASALGLATRFDDDLVEADVGAFSGLTWEEFRAAHPEAVGAYEAAEAANPHPRNRERFLPGWEPLDQVIDRVWGAIGRIAAAHPGERVVVVAHGGVLNAFVTHLLEGDAREGVWKYHFTNCAITHVALSPAGPRAACLVDATHLEPLKRSTRRPEADSPAL